MRSPDAKQIVGRTDLDDELFRAAGSYVSDVSEGRYPDDAHSYT
jgi:ketopantoate hydroxymethyltransferase